MKSVARIGLFFPVFFLLGCASSGVQVLDSGAAGRPLTDDRHHSPASIISPDILTGKKVIDGVHLRTQADYHYALGEALSMEGRSLQAVEAFKAVLVYDPESIVVRLRLAAELMKMGMVSEAVQQAQVAKKQDPESISARLLLGGLYSTFRMYTAAMREYEEVLELDPQNQEAPLFIGALHAEQKNYDQAISYFESLAEREDYESPHIPYYYIGRIFLEKADSAEGFKAADRALKKSLELKPNYLEAALALGLLYQSTARVPDAIKLYTRYQSTQGAHPRLTEALAHLYLEADRLEEALEQLTLLEQLGGQNLSNRVKIALVLVETKRYPEAIEKLHQILDEAPDADKIRFYLAAVYEEVRDYPAAIEHFLQIPVSSSFYSDAIVHASYLQKVLGRGEEALQTIRQGVESDKRTAQMYALYASLLDDQGEHQTAADMLKAATERFPNNAQLHFFLGSMYDRLGLTEATIQQMQKVVELDPNHVQGLNYLAYTYAENDRNLHEAEKLARRALLMEPEDGYILDTLGWILYKQGRNKEAIQVLEAAFAQQPDEAIIAEHLGDAYYRQEMVEKARRMYERAVAIETDTEKAERLRTKISAMDDFQVREVQRMPASENPRHQD